MVGMESSTDRIQIAIKGMRGSGKTTFLLNLVNVLREKGIRVKGIVSPAAFEDGRKTAIELVDLATDARHVLARLVKKTRSTLQFGDWAFFEETINWGNACLSKIRFTDVLVVDEIGPLELDLGSGFQAGLDQLAAGHYRVGILSIRPKCEEGLLSRFQEMKVYSLADWTSEDLINEILRIAFI